MNIQQGAVGALRAGIAVFALFITAALYAQSDYPTRPLRMLIPFPAGGAADLIGRTIGEKLAMQLGQAVVIDNRPGAGGVLCAELLANASPDGHTLMVGVPGAMVIAPMLNKRISYRPERDFLPVTRVTEVLNVMVVSPDTGVKSIPEFIQWARKRPDDVRFGSSGAGQPDHLAGEFFKRLAKVEMTHVPYKGGGPALIDLIAGRIQVMFSTYIVARPHAQAGRLRVLAVITPTRQPLLPDLPTVGESVPGFGLSNWNGIFLPAKTPAPIARRLFLEINQAIKYPDLKKRQNDSGIEPVGSASQEDFRRFFREEHERWGKIIRDAGIRIE
jgi:tripartite-type tricarboxylate transporter receptor subunit TctC